MIRNKANYLTSTEAATLLGFSADHIRNLINQGKLKAEKIGRNWIIDKKNLSKVSRQRFPRKKEPNNERSGKR